MGYTLQVYNTRAHEIDFMANKGNNQYYILYMMTSISFWAIIHL